MDSNDLLERLELLAQQNADLILANAKFNDRITGMGKTMVEHKKEIENLLFKNAEKLYTLGEFHKTLQKKYEIWPTQSPTITHINLALSKALNELKTPDLTGSGQRNSKVLSIDDMRSDFLSKFKLHELFFDQYMTHNEYSEDILVSVIGHSSGEWKQSISIIDCKKEGPLKDLGEFSKTISWMKRIHMHAMLGYGKNEEGP